MDPELQKAIAQIKPNERDDVARSFFKHLKQRGLDECHLERDLGLSTHNANHMNADDLSKLASFTYHSHPDIFQEVMAEQPVLIKFLSNPVVGAALGAITAKWFGGHRISDRLKHIPPKWILNRLRTIIKKSYFEELSLSSSLYSNFERNSTPI